MGVSIHFSGTIRADMIEPLCAELADIATSLEFEESVPVNDDEKGLRGIILCPASEMESIPFLFDSKGRMHALGDLIAGWTRENAIFSVAVKTQYAGEASHIWLVGLLRYIQRKYIPNLKVTDEGGYWESDDPEELKRRIESLGAIIKSFGSELESAFMDAVVDKNDPNALADFIERVVCNFRAKEQN
ncbi:hypothetical protein [Pontiella sulfatireligans]|uniref:Uncharacterized protein n=1 Tax=Pontiella sulfatireligans TaxID=2750658 RepID=A0A6C2UGI1_9BACT|nr:hypothetical protein [Pontiella sulfatireligans]VGO19029.1 hypothetical protein SCARR_01084 [Pontiella sulfatireligans]